MQEIQAIQASTHLANNQENVPAKTDLASSNENSTENKSWQDDSIKVTLSSHAESHKEVKDIQAEHQIQQKKNVENQDIDYSLAMSGIPQYGGRLVTVIKYPDGRTEMVDAFSGKKLTQQDLEMAQLLKESRQAVQKDIQQRQNDMPGASEPTDLE